MAFSAPPEQSLHLGTQAAAGPPVSRPAPTPSREARHPRRRRHNAGPRRIGERSPCPRRTVSAESPAKHPKKDEERVGPRAADGSYLRIRARRSAVLAAGGFSASREMMSKYRRYFRGGRGACGVGPAMNGLYRGEWRQTVLWACAAKNCPARQCSGRPPRLGRALRLPLRACE